MTGASGRNWSGYGSRVKLAAKLGETEKALLTDPQTSGGLLVACAPQACDAVLEIFRSEGFDDAAVIGEIVQGAPEVRVE
jgi:selenide,water dikinase